MPTLMQHEKHGFTHAYNTVDKAYLESLGWMEKREEVKQDEESIRQAYFDKFGKKPHHMMKLENIRKALNDDSE